MLCSVVAFLQFFYFFSASCFFVCSFLLCSECEQGLNPALPPKAKNCADGEGRGEVED